MTITTILESTRGRYYESGVTHYDSREVDVGDRAVETFSVKIICCSADPASRVRGPQMNTD